MDERSFGDEAEALLGVTLPERAPGRAHGEASSALAPDRTGLIRPEATVEGVTLENADSGRITAIMHETATGFAPATRQSILASGKDLLIFIHGFRPSKEDREAFEREFPDGDRMTD